MKFWQLIAFSTTLLLSDQGWSSVKAYFNHNPNTRYTDPYRNIARNGDNLEQVILDQIRNAKKSVFVAVQELRLPLIASALIEKKKAGLDVRVVLEHDYNFTVLSQADRSGEDEYEATKLNELRAFVDLNQNGKIEKTELQTRDAIYMLQEAKVPMMDDTADGSSGSGLMHHKFVIIDEKIIVTGSANFTMSCTHGDMLVSGSRGNANSMVVIQSAAAAKIFVEEYSQMWGSGKRGNFGHNKTYRGPQTVEVRGIKISIQFSPTSARYNWEESVNGLMALHLAKATKSVKAALFVFSDQKLANVLEKIHLAGAEVGILIEPKFAFRDYSELLDVLGIRMLNAKCTYEADNQVWKNPISEAGMAILTRGDVLHHKFAVIDDKTTIVGSENWSDSANYINDETLMVIQDQGISELYAQEYVRIKKSSLLGPSEKIKAEIQRLEAACADRGLYF